MTKLSSSTIIGVLGAGTMGSGIAQVSATAGHKTILFDTNTTILQKAREEILKNLSRLVEKGKINQARSEEIFGLINIASSMSGFSVCGIVIEAIVEDLKVKQSVFTELEKIISTDAILATNTSSLSVTSIASACQHPERFIGIHFFNPAPLMPLVEVIPGLATNPVLADDIKIFLEKWGKSVVTVKDTPGFIVNRIARPFYGESIRIFEERWNGLPEGGQGFATIDWAMKEIGGFRMGPFELMDLIGNDINFTVTETVWTQFFYDPRYKPSLTQKRLMEAKRFGKKSGQGYYNYSAGSLQPEAVQDKKLGEAIVQRVLVMLINEAVDALYLGIASRDNLDLAMIKGVNYPKGLLKWCDEIGAGKILAVIEELLRTYNEERYRPSVLLRKMAKENQKFYPGN